MGVAVQLQRRAPQLVADAAVVVDAERHEAGEVAAAIAVGEIGVALPLAAEADLETRLGRLEQGLDALVFATRLRVVGIVEHHALIGRQRLAQLAPTLGLFGVAHIGAGVGWIEDDLAEELLQIGRLLRRSRRNSGDGDGCGKRHADSGSRFGSRRNIKLKQSSHPLTGGPRVLPLERRVPSRPVALATD
jgi:hypothetical protein